MSTVDSLDLKLLGVFAGSIALLGILAAIFAVIPDGDVVTVHARVFSAVALVSCVVTVGACMRAVTTHRWSNSPQVANLVQDMRNGEPADAIAWRTLRSLVEASRRNAPMLEAKGAVFDLSLIGLLVEGVAIVVLVIGAL